MNSAAAAPAPAADLVLDVHLCDQRRCYQVTFMAGPVADATAAAFIAARTSYTAIEEVGDAECDDYAAWPLTYAALYPECEHGLSLRLCEGPMHYMSAAQERERYG